MSTSYHDWLTVGRSSMKLTPNQRSVLSELADGECLSAAEIARRSGRQHLPGVIRVLESLRDSGLISRLDGPVTRRWQAAGAADRGQTVPRR